MVSDLISKLLDNPSTAAKIGAQAKKYVLANASMSNSADGFMECIHKAMQE